MSWKVQQAVFQSDLPGIATQQRMQAKLVLLAIAHFTDDTGRNAWPAVATIASAACCSGRTVQRLTKTLLAAGFIAEQAPACRHRPTTYRVDMARLGVTALSPLPVLGVTRTQSRGDTEAVLGVTALSPERTYGNLKENYVHALPDNARRTIDAQHVAAHAYQQLQPTARAQLERDARVELAGLLSLQPPEKIPAMIRNHVHLYLRDPRVRQMFLGMTVTADARTA